MAEKDKTPGEKHVGPAYPARYVGLWRANLNTPLRRIIVLAALIAVVAIVLAVLLPE